MERRKLKYILYSIALTTSTLCFLFSFVVLHVLINDSSKSFLFFNISLGRIAILDLCLLIMGVGFFVLFFSTLILLFEARNSPSFIMPYFFPSKYQINDKGGDQNN